MLRGRNIVLGVTGGIAAYKAVSLCRHLMEAGAHVSPVLTEGALRFIGAPTFSALASEPVQTSLFDGVDPIPHIGLGQAADLILVAPATARLLGSYAAGISDDLLTATLLATRAPVVVCPAMHTEMWEHAAVRANIATLRERGVHIVEPGFGRLAGGNDGAGRLADPEAILAAVVRVLGPRDFEGVRLLVTAGGTREAIDPVRFVGNRSSGRQGHALAAEAHARGAEVTLITTSDVDRPHGVAVIAVETAAGMQAEVEARCDADVIIMAAAVADFRPMNAASSKIKKSAGVPELVLEPTVDILVGLGQSKGVGQVIVGFAAETEDLADNAMAKLKAKNADIIVANDVSAPLTGFGHETNAVTIYTVDGSAVEISLRSKREVARRVLDAVAEIRSPGPSSQPATDSDDLHTDNRS